MYDSISLSTTTEERKAQWIPVAIRPSDDRLVETKIEDRDGVRNETRLRFAKNMWWLPDMSMYVYYTPTHWREL